MFRRNKRGEQQAVDQAEAERTDLPPADEAEPPPLVREEVVRSRRRRQTLQVNGVRLLLILVLAAGAVAVGRGRVPVIAQGLVGNGPLVLLAVGVVGMLAGVVAAWMPGALAGPLIAAVGVGLWAQQNGYEVTWMVFSGVLLAGMGISVMVRGLTMQR